MDAQFLGNTPGRTSKAQQKGGENPVGEGALAAVQECAREVIEGALAVLLLTAVAFQSGLVVIRPPGTNVVALAPRALQRTVFPSECMDIRLALFEAEEVVHIWERRHRWASPVVLSWGQKWRGDSHLFQRFYAATNPDKLSVQINTQEAAGLPLVQRFYQVWTPDLRVVAPEGVDLYGSVSKVEMVTPMDLIYKVLFLSISTFETPPPWL
jgi:hypothetical protein